MIIFGLLKTVAGYSRVPCLAITLLASWTSAGAVATDTKATAAAVVPTHVSYLGYQEVPWPLAAVAGLDLLLRPAFSSVPSEALDMFGLAFSSLAFGVAALWLAAPYLSRLRRRHRDRRLARTMNPYPCGWLGQAWLGIRQNVGRPEASSLSDWLGVFVLAALMVGRVNGEQGVTLGPNTSFSTPASPVVVMPVVFRDPHLGAAGSPTEGAQGTRMLQMRALAPTCRQYLEALLVEAGLQVIPMAAVDDWLKANASDWATPEGRGRERLQKLLADLGAKQVVCLDFYGGSVTRRARTLDVLTYQLAAPDVVTVWGTMEVYGASGAPVLVLDAGAQVKNRSEFKALGESVFGIVLAAVCAQIPPGPGLTGVRGDALASSMPLSQVFAGDTALAAARARARLVERCVAQWLGRPMKELQRLSPPALEGLRWVAFQPVHRAERSAFRMVLKRGDAVGVSFVNYPAGAARRSVVPLLGYEDEVLKQQPIAKAMAKSYQKKQADQTSRSDAELLQALISEAAKLGIRVKPLDTEPVYTTGAMQEISAPALAERAGRAGCQLVLALSSARRSQGTRGRSFETSASATTTGPAQVNRLSTTASGPPADVAHAILQRLILVSEE